MPYEPLVPTATHSCLTTTCSVIQLCFFSAFTLASSPVLHVNRRRRYKPCLCTYNISLHGLAGILFFFYHSHVLTSANQILDPIDLVHQLQTSLLFTSQAPVGAMLCSATSQSMTNIKTCLYVDTIKSSHRTGKRSPTIHTDKIISRDASPRQQGGTPRTRWL